MVFFAYSLSCGAHMTKMLSEYTQPEISQAIQDRNLFSEDLSYAGRLVDRLDDPKMKTAFDKIAKALITGENAERGGVGFGNRQNIGIGIQRAIQGDFGVLDRFIENANSGTASETLVAHAETIKARIEIYCERGGIEMASHTASDPAIHAKPSTTTRPMIKPTI
jgi:hypothetical protein